MDLDRYRGHENKTRLCFVSKKWGFGESLCPFQPRKLFLIEKKNTKNIKTLPNFALHDVSTDAIEGINKHSYQCVDCSLAFK